MDISKDINHRQNNIQSIADSVGGTILDTRTL